jgi:hypothetical protein
VLGLFRLNHLTQFNKVVANGSARATMYMETGRVSLPEMQSPLAAFRGLFIAMLISAPIWVVLTAAYMHYRTH